MTSRFSGKESSLVLSLRLAIKWFETLSLMIMCVPTPCLAEEQTSQETVKASHLSPSAARISSLIFTHHCYTNSVCCLPTLSRAGNKGKGFMYRIKRNKMENLQSVQRPSVLSRILRLTLTRYVGCNARGGPAWGHFKVTTYSTDST